VSVPRDAGEFREQLVVQIRHLRRSAREFDDGDESEGLRLAVTIRNLVHDTAGRTTSLLTHLGVKSTLRYVDTRPHTPPGVPAGTIMIHAGLVIVTATLGPGGGSRFEAALDRREQARVGFDVWWSEPFVEDQRGTGFARSDIVLSVANQDGGAHIDATLGAQWAALTREGSLGLEIADEHGRMHHRGQSLALATVRQIAYELDQTLSSQAPALGLA
jgi:hypothetical protein